MVCEMPVRAASAKLEVTIEAGFPGAIDAAATAADARHRFLRSAWFEAAGGSDPLTVVATRGDGRVIAALPRVRAGPRMLGIVAVAGSYWPFRSFPIAADATVDELVALLCAPAARRALGRAWRLGPVMTSDPTLVRLLQAAPRSGFSVLERRAGTAFTLDIAGKRKVEPWPRPSTLRNNQKHQKRLEKLGLLEWRFVTGDAWSSDIFEDLARIEGNSWVGRTEGADAKFLHPLRRRGWENMVGDPVIASMLSTGILYVDGRPASFSFGIDCARTRYCVATSYDDQFAKHSPGYLTGYRTYIEAVERGVDILNLGAGDRGEKSSMGAAPEFEIADYLFVRGPWLAGLLRPVWKRSGKS